MKHLQSIIDPELINRALEGIRSFNQISDVGFKKLATYGWYIDADFTLGETTGLMQKAMANDKIFVDEYFMNYYSSIISKKVERISKKHDDRSSIINEALECHNDKKYHASTTLFLSQADGMCRGLLFKISRNKKALKEYIAKNEGGSFFSILMSSIENQNAIDTLYSELNNYESQLNRHGVMHGLDTNFGNEINSLKAFSLLSFVSDFIDRYTKQ